ncbi:unnamed protein product [Symbiodinium sp. KB8]|nr:unnamed protein product [Symbiodinium sp. KB8]
MVRGRATLGAGGASAVLAVSMLAVMLMVSSLVDMEEVEEEDEEVVRFFFLRTSGRRASRRSTRLSEGAEQRMLSQPPVSPDSAESELFTGDGQDGFQRKSEVRHPERPTELTLVLDADNIDEMKSIVWKFTEQGACVKALNKHCPKATPEDIRAGDILMFVNEEFVLDKDKKVTQRIWKDENLGLVKYACR